MAATPQKLTVVNLFGAPGVGKSSVRSGVFWLMKSYGASCEEVSEYAKMAILQRREWLLKEDQVYVLAQQHQKQLILRGHYEYAITDSPLALSDFYAGRDIFKSFSALVEDLSTCFENINFYLTRDLTAAPFEEAGRRHRLEDSLRIDQELRQYLIDRGIQCTEMPIDLTTPWRIVEHVLPGLAPLPQFPPR